MKTHLTLYAFMLATANVFAGVQTVEKKTYVAARVNPHQPILDGRIDDIIWQKAQVEGNFVQIEPRENAAPTEKTTFQIAYDENNLYVAIRAHDTQASKIVRRTTRRDDGSDADQVGIILDSFFDHRTAFEFAVNAAGVKNDALWSNDGDNQDDSWDPIWFVATAVDDSGWTAEMRIPYSQLRFANHTEQVWGLEVYRNLYRLQEISAWQFIPHDSPGTVHRFGELHGLQNIKMPRRIEALPYSVSKMRRFQKESGNPFATGRISNLDVGLDGKIGVTGDLTLDFTVNPDFGQVEADPSEVNLTAFETFFEEKRPFFIEGKNILNYPLMIGDGDLARESLFYSRRIGRSPHHEPDTNDDEYLRMPENTSILTAMKLTGKTQKGWSIGMLDAVTAKETAEIASNGMRRDEAVEPATNYFLGRLQKDYHDGSTTIGGIVTATHRNLTDSELQFLNRAAYTGGFDFRHQWKNRTYYIDIRTAYSHVRGSQEAMLEAQTASARYFQRPDAHYVRVDSSRTSLSGHGGFVGIGKGGNGHWQYVLGGAWRSPGFELNDLGYLRRADNILQFTWAGFRQWNPFSIFRRLNINFNQWMGWNFGGEQTFAGGNVNGGGQFRNYWGLWMGFNREGPSLSTSSLRGGPAMKFPGSWSSWYEIDSDDRKTFQVNINGYHNWNDDDLTRYHNLSLGMTWRPNNAMRISVGPFLNINKDNLQYVDTVELADSDRYVFARIDQKTLGLTFRMNYSLTPGLSIQYYGQPFVSAGEYSRFKLITQPRANRYEDRFRTLASAEIHYIAADEVFEIDENANGIVKYQIDDPNFNFRQLRSNLVIRWEYSPGSTLFLVWSQGRTGFESNGNFAFSNVRDLFNVYPDNVFLVKFNHWFSL